MPSRLATIAVDALDPERIAAFWCAVLDWHVLERDDGWIGIGPADDAGVTGPGIDVAPVPQGKTVKNRLHLDLKTSGGTEVEELARLEALGATRVDVGQPEDATWVVLADPEGNEFCLLLPRPEREL